MMRHTLANSPQPSVVLDVYLREIRETSLLSAEEESTLAEAIARGDSDARTRMIRANLRLVVKIARDYVGRGLVLDDLIGEGNLGLIRAAEEFDPAFGTRFSTYASYWIKQAIRHALTNTTATIRLPAHMVGIITKWRRAERALARELGQAPTEDQIAVQLGLTDAQIELVRRARRASRLQFESGHGSDGGSWSPDESADEREAPVLTIDAADERTHLLRRLDRLNERERMIVNLRYGLEGNDPMTLKDVGRLMGVTREWVRKIELRAVQKMEADEAPVAPTMPTKVTRHPAQSAAEETRLRRRRPAAAPVMN
jgi:RNA polymerase primary sigma factor